MSRPPYPSDPRDRRRPDSQRSGASRSVGAATALLRGDWRGMIDVVILGALLILCALGGGSAFADTLSLLYVRPAAVIALVAFLLTPACADWRALRAPLAMLAVLALIMLAQLVPLPPSIWLSLPARAPYAEAANAAGIAQPWRPLSLAPDLTLNSLVALVIPAAVLVGFAKITDDQRRALVVALVILACASAALGVAQFAGGAGSALYLYKRTYYGFPVGLLANRNHQAVLLALIFPALRVWTLRPAANRATARRRHWLALAGAAFALLVILATGSRAGILVGMLAIIATLAFPAPRSSETAADETGRARLMRLGVPLLLLLVMGLSYWLGRAVSFERFLSLAVSEDQRFEFAPVVIRIVKASFPVGTGFGSFDPVFRQYEPSGAMIATYFNHAHNELLELAMTAGLPGLLLLVAFFVWWARRVVEALKGKGESDFRPYVLLGGIAVVILLGASLVDYPLRTPLMSAVFALACGWLCMPARTHAGE